jgi:hypothetical protein
MTNVEVDYTRHPPFGSQGKSFTPLIRGPPPHELPLEPPPLPDADVELLVMLVLRCGPIRFHSVYRPSTATNIKAEEERQHNTALTNEKPIA